MGGNEYVIAAGLLVAIIIGVAQIIWDVSQDIKNDRDL